MKGSEKKRMVGGTGKQDKKKKKNLEKRNKSSGNRASSVEQWECIAVLIRVAKREMTICLLLFFIRT